MLFTLSALSLAALATEGTATVPVDQLLKLHADAATATDAAPSEARPAAPPVPATLNRVAMAGRILGDTVAIEATVKVSVLSRDEWTVVPLMTLGPDLELSELAPLSKGWLMVEGDTLNLVVNAPGTYDFPLSLSLYAADLGGGRRAARVALADPLSASLKLNYDPQRIAITEGGPVRIESDGVIVRPVDGVLQVQWAPAAEAVEEAAAEAAPVAARRTREPTVDRAVVSVVSTLEGTRLTRAWYELSFEGRASLTLDWPEHQSLKRVYINGTPMELEAEGSAITLALEPDQDGGDAGTVELVLSEEHGGYLLSGSLDFVMPTVSWPTRELACSLHLPEVFNYAWSGGSMEAYAAGPEAVFAYDVPTPGRVTSWHQELVISAAPTLRVDYDVDLEGAYYRP